MLAIQSDANAMSTRCLRAVGDTIIVRASMILIDGRIHSCSNAGLDNHLQRTAAKALFAYEHMSSVSCFRVYLSGATGKRIPFVRDHTSVLQTLEYRSSSWT